MTCPTCGSSSASACPCGVVSHPWVVFNPPNQPTIAYRVGDYAAFRHALLRALPGETELTQTANGQTTQVWRPGADGDLGVQLLEWWAYLADVLTFYNERLATQAYLGVADLPESVNRLIQILGYRPRPGIGASGVLAAILGSSKPITLPQGFKVQSKPGPGQSPQIFELSAATTLQPPSKVAARTAPASTSATLLTPDGTGVWLAGTVAGIKPGDQLLLVNSDAVTGGAIGAYAWARVASSQPGKNAYGDPVTMVSFTEALEGFPANAAAGGFALLRSTVSSPPWSAKPGGWSTPIIGTGGIDLASVARTLSPGSLALLEVGGTPTSAAVATTLVSILGYSEVVWYANGNGPNPPGGSNPPVSIPHSHVDFAPSIDASWNDNVSLVTVRFGWQSVGQLAPVLSGAQAALNATSMAVTAGSVFPAGLDLPVLLQDAAGKGAAAVGTAGADGVGMTLASITRLPPGGLGSTFDVLFDLFPVTRGETVANEVLGSGDAAVASQDFQLKKSPVTYFSDASSRSGDNFSSTVQVWVSGLLWSEVPSFFDQTPTAAVYVTREDEQGNTHVTFGDGLNGARLPTGVDNVVATYRTGSGASSPAPGTLTNILQPQPGLQSLANPVAPTGGADPQPMTQIRELAPRSVLTFGRAISIDDYQAIAAGTPGVVQAAAAYSFDPIAQRPQVTIWVSGDAGAVAAVQAILAGEADPNRPISVLAASGVDTTISLTCVRDPRFLDTAVQAAVRAALIDPDTGLFGANAVGIGQAFFDSQIYAACLAVPGVLAVENLTVQVGPRFRILFRPVRVRRGLLPLGAATPCAAERYDPGAGRYISVPDDGSHLLLSTRVPS
jgi:hypothetical protein